MGFEEVDNVLLELVVGVEYAGDEDVDQVDLEVVVGVE